MGAVKRQRGKAGRAAARAPEPKTFGEACIEKHMEIALGIVVLIVGLNLLLPNLRESYTLSTYQTRLPARQFTSFLPKFIYLSYLDPTTGKYFKGNDDIYFVGFWAVVWIFLREFQMRWIWKPMATLVGVKKGGKVTRFAEQGWNLAYYSVFWSMGMKILLSYYPGPLLDVRQYWNGYPHDCLPALTKFYYLSQTAFWFQQMLVINIEKRRKDYFQMFTHHIVTTLLVCTSYCTNFTGIGTAIHTTMDLSDILLSTSKMQKYAEVGLICDLNFLGFLGSWLVTRHYIFLKIVYNIYAYLPGDVGFHWIPTEGRFLTFGTWCGFLTLLLSLQVLLCLWLAMIIRVLVKVVSGKGVDDERSDSEDTSDDEEDDEPVKRPLANGHSNGHANGHANGSAGNGKVGLEESRKTR